MLVQSQLARLNQLKGEAYQAPDDFKIADTAAQALPLTAREFAYWALFTELDKGKSISSGKVWKRFMSRWQMICKTRKIQMPLTPFQALSQRW